MATQKPSAAPVWAEQGLTEKPTDQKIEQGWIAEIPTFGNFNWILNFLAAFNQHVNEQGIPVWDNETDFPINAITKGSDGNLYKGKTGTASGGNQGNDPVSSPTHWDAEFIGSGGISWSTQTTNFNAEAGNGYIAAGGLTVPLPASPNDGDQIVFSDYTNNWNVSPIIIQGNGKNIEGSANRTYRELGGVVNLVFSSTADEWQRIGRTPAPYLGEDAPIRLNSNTIREDMTVPTGYNGMTAGPITVDDGVTVTISDGSTWVVV